MLNIFVKLIRILNKIIAIIAILLALILFSYGGYSLWETYEIYKGSFVSEDLMRYKPKDDAKLGGANPTLYDLKNINEDTVAWLTIDDTNIDYPVLQGEDDMEYVDKDIYGNVSVYGAIFLASGNDREFNDSYSIMFGHHMDNDSMFGDVAKYQNEEFFDSHRDGTLFLPESTYNVEVFASLHVDAYDAIAYSYGDRDESDMDTLLNYVRDNAVIYRDIGVTKNDKILALSTCDNHHLYGRSLVYCRLTARGFISQGESKTETRVYKSESYTVRRGIKRYSWAIVNLICLIVSLCGGLDLVLKFENRKEYYIGIIIELLLNIMLVYIFIITEDMKLNSVWVDKWTFPMIIGVVLVFIVNIMVGKKKRKQIEKNNNEVKDNVND